MNLTSRVEGRVDAWWMLRNTWTMESWNPTLSHAEAGTTIYWKQIQYCLERMDMQKKKG